MKLVGAVSVVGLLMLVAVVWAPTSRGSEVVKRPDVGTRPGQVGHGTPLHAGAGHQLAVFSQGCFWGTENRFRQIPGVVATAVGYTGGTATNPSYEDVCSHTTGHAESVLIEFDPAKISYQKLLEVFWSSHNPTSGERQGPDVGNQYRSAIFTFGDEQQKVALASKAEAQKALADPITTQIAPLSQFWVAEDYHQQWDEKHGRESCPLPEHARRK